MSQAVAALEAVRAEEVGLSTEKPRLLKGGGSGLVSTAPDYARFCQMLLNGGELGGARLLGRKTVDLMTTNLTGASSPLPAEWPQDWGCWPMGSGLA